MDVIVLMGVSGCGKSAVGRALAAELGWEFVEGDDFHPPVNVQKMARGEALTDGDRWGWLAAIRDETVRICAGGRRCVVACSALRAAYRDVLRDAGGLRVAFVHLVGDERLIRERMAAREHFMKPSMLASQFATLEAPGPGEAVRVEVARPIERIVAEVRRALGV